MPTILPWTNFNKMIKKRRKKFPLVVIATTNRFIRPIGE